MEMANDRLIQLLRDNKIEVPEEYSGYKTRGIILAELKELEREQESLERPESSD